MGSFLLIAQIYHFETVVERYHMGVFSLIRKFVKENHHIDQEIERLIARNIPVNKKKEQLQREEGVSMLWGDIALSLSSSGFEILPAICT